MFEWIVTIIIVLLVFWIGGTLFAIRGIEEPSYNVMEEKRWYEIREYDDYLVAEVEIQWEGQEVLNKWFRVLAGYIFWWNTSKESISMTAPVTDTEKKSEKIAMTTPVSDVDTWNDIHKVRFALPREYSLETLPIPDNNSIQLKQIASYRAAALSYTWWATQKRVKAKKERLEQLLKRDWVKILGDMKSAQYNPPMSFPLLIRNEIIVPIKK